MLLCATSYVHVPMHFVGVVSGSVVVQLGIRLSESVPGQRNLLVNDIAFIKIRCLYKYKQLSLGYAQSFASCSFASQKTPRF